VAKTRAQLRQRLLDSGFSYLAQAQADDFVDEAALEFTLLALWPWRLKTEVLAAAPLNVGALLGPVITVTDVNGEAVEPRRYEELLDRYGAALATVGSPALFYWLEDATIKTYPANAQISVRHHARRIWTTGGRNAASDADTLLCDLEGEDVVYQLARARCKDFNDDFDEGNAIRAEALRRGSELAETELAPQLDEPDVIELNEYY
jgi:hypothetical protein